MLDQVLEVFKIKSDYDFDIMKDRQTFAGITTKALKGLDLIMKEVKPDLVLVGETMLGMFRAIKRIVNEHDDVHVVYPVHLNLAVREVANEIFGSEERVHLIEPLGVLDFHNFASRSFLILTDSGGVQEEAPSLGVPVLVLRDTTERPEGIEAGTLRLAGTEEETTYEMTHSLLNDKAAYKKMSNASNPYGDGLASYRIVQSILHYFGRSESRPEPFKPF